MEQKNVNFCMTHSPKQIDYCNCDLGDFKGVCGVLRRIPAPGSQDLHREIQIGTVAGEMQCPQCRGFAMKAGQKRDAKERMQLISPATQQHRESRCRAVIG